MRIHREISPELRNGAAVSMPVDLSVEEIAGSQ
jgi:hypothetical protein